MRDPDEPEDDDQFAASDPNDEPAPLDELPFPSFSPVPADLHSSYSRRPFETCLECDRSLLTGSSPYVIHKVFRSGECIFEFALCTDCGRDTGESISEESRHNIEAYLAEHAPRDLGMDRCNLCGTSTRTDCDEYVLFGLAHGSVLLGSGHMFCDSCTVGLEALLSEATRRGMDDFTTRNFPGVPANLDLPLIFAM